MRFVLVFGHQLKLRKEAARVCLEGLQDVSGERIPQRRADLRQEALQWVHGDYDSFVL